MTFSGTFLLCLSALLLGASGTGLAGKSGIVMGFAAEGIMLLGGFAGILASRLSPAAALLLAGCAGLLFSMPLMLFSQRGRGNQILGGMGLTLMAAALAMILARLLGGVSYNRKAFEFMLNGEPLPVFFPAALLLWFLCWLLLRFTRLGGRIQLCGENRKAAENMGIHTRFIQMISAMAGGFLCGIGGLSALVFLGSGWSVKLGAGGLGFLALSVMILGRGKPLPNLLVSVLFAAVEACAVFFADSWPQIPQEAFRTIPFLIALVLLAFFHHPQSIPRETARNLGMEE